MEVGWSIHTITTVSMALPTNSWDPRSVWMPSVCVPIHPTWWSLIDNNRVRGKVSPFDNSSPMNVVVSDLFTWNASHPNDRILFQISGRSATASRQCILLQMLASTPIRWQVSVRIRSSAVLCWRTHLYNLSRRWDRRKKYCFSWRRWASNMSLALLVYRVGVVRCVSTGDRSAMGSSTVIVAMMKSSNFALKSSWTNAMQSESFAVRMACAFLSISGRMVNLTVSTAKRRKILPWRSVRSISELLCWRRIRCWRCVLFRRAILMWQWTVHLLH